MIHLLLNVTHPPSVCPILQPVEQTYLYIFPFRQLTLTFLLAGIVGWQLLVGRDKSPCVAVYMCTVLGASAAVAIFTLRAWILLFRKTRGGQCEAAESRVMECCGLSEGFTGRGVVSVVFVDLYLCLADPQCSF